MEISRTGNTPFQMQTYQQQTTAGTPGNTFQELVSAQIARPSCDTFTLSSETPAVDTESAAAELATDSALAAARTEIAAPVENSVTILPTDSTEVKLAKLREIADASDYTGMSYEDIYTEIWNRYNDAFDGNIEAIRSLAIVGPNDWTDIYNQFEQETIQNVFNPLSDEFRDQGLPEGEEKPVGYKTQYISDIRSAPLGYSGMSYEEKEAAILEKYKGKNSLMDFLNMQGELKDSKVYQSKMGRAGERAFLSQLSFETTRNHVEMKYARNVIKDWSGKDPVSALTNEQWSSILNMRFDSHTLLMDMKSHLNFEESNGYNIFAQIDKLLLAIDKTDN